MTTLAPWHVIKSTELLDRSPWLRVMLDHVQLPNGVEIEDFHRVEMLEWAQVFAVTDDGRVPMMQMYRHGPGVVSLELPAGYIDVGESPDSTVHRELREEAGVAADDWRYLGRFFTDGNRGCGATHVYLARGAQQIGHMDHEDTELMTLRWLTLAEVRAAWLGGQMPNVATMAAVGLALTMLEDGA